MKKNITSVRSLFLGFNLLSFLCLTFSPVSLKAQEKNPPSAETYTVGIGLGTRFIERNSDGTYTGFEIQLWEEIAKSLGINFVYKEYPSFQNLLEALKSSKVDLAIWSITMTRDRANYATFSEPYFISRLSILTKENDLHSFFGILKTLFRPIVGKMVLAIFVVMFVFGNLLWLTERGGTSIISRDYFPGVFQAMWCTFAIQSTIGFGDIIPHRWFARFLAIPIWLCGLFLVAVITAELLTDFTNPDSRSNIRTYQDLKGKVVATVGGTTSAKVLDQIGVKQIVTVPRNLEEVYSRVEKGEIDAIVFDYPYIANVAKNLKSQGKRPYVVPDRFDEQFYAIALNKTFARQRPELLEKINLTILDLRDNGFIDQIKEKWFGDLGFH